MLGLFHPRELVVRTAVGVTRLDARTLGGPRRFADPGGVELEVPGKIRRRFRGEVEIFVAGDELRAVARLPRRTYLAAVVAAEMPAAAPAAALEAQAIVSRSYLLGTAARHRGGRVCDTTHCQWMREAPPADHPAWRAVDRTAGVALRVDGRVLPALYGRSCGGRTRAGLEAADARFRAVDCSACRRRPTRWTRAAPPEEWTSILAARESEAARLEVVRRWGWDRLPSSAFTAGREEGTVRLEGVGEGHGVGLCQRGALELARGGASAAEILRVYFPHAALGVVQ